MADNLNVQNSGEIDSTINEEPSKSPLEETVSPDSPLGNQPQVSQPETFPTIPESPAPPVGEQNLGVSSVPPSTDEFLSSVLERKPETSPIDGQKTDSVSTMATEPAPPLNAPTELPQNDEFNNSMPSGNSVAEPPVNYPLTPKEDYEQPINSPLEQPKQYDPLENQIAGAPESSPAKEIPTPDTTGIKQEDSFGVPASEPKITDEVKLDGLQTPTPPAPPTPPPTGPDSPVSSNVFSESPQGKLGSKMIVIVVLILIVLGGAYYAYTKFFGASNNTEQPLVTSSATATSILSNKDTQRKADLALVKDAIMNYYAGSGQYPIANELTMLNQSGNILEKALVPSYLSKLPVDPDPTKYYAYKSDGSTFVVSAVLDNASDPEAVVEGGKALYKVTEISSNASASEGVTTTPLPTASTTSASSFPPAPVDDAQTATSTTNDVPPSLNSNF